METDTWQVYVGCDRVTCSTIAPSPDAVKLRLMPPGGASDLAFTRPLGRHNVPWESRPAVGA